MLYNCVTCVTPRIYILESIYIVKNTNVHERKTNRCIYFYIEKRGKVTQLYAELETPDI